MQKRQVIVSVILILVILGCASTALLVWRRQQVVALVAAKVPAIPDLGRWPEAFSNEVQEATARARSGSDPVGSLSQLVNLYLGNSYVVQAMPPLAALSRLEPSNARWCYLLADSHMRLGETNAAEAGFRKTTVLDPKYAMAWIRLGLLLTQRGNVNEAHACYVKAAAADSSNLMPSFLLIEFEARNEGGPEVRTRLEDFSRAHPEFKDPHALLAVMSEGAGDPTAAARERQAAATAPLLLPSEDPWLDQLARYCFDAERLRELSMAAFSQGRIEETEALVKRGVQMAPKDPVLRDVLCSVDERKGLMEDALRARQEAVIDCPDDPNLRVQLSRLLCSLHRPDDAIEALRPAVQRWPENAKLHAALGYALSNTGKSDQAVAEFQEAIRLDFTQVEVRYNLAAALLAGGQRDAARESARKALEMRPDYVDAMSLLGTLALEDGDLAAAEPPVSRLYALQPENPGTQTLYCGLQLLKGTVAERSGKLDEAKTAYRAGLAVYANDWRLLRAQGVLAVRQDQLPDAVESFRGYVRAQPGKTEAYYMLGLVLKKSGQADEARKVFQQGLDLEKPNGNNAREIEAFKRALEQP